MKFPRHRNLSDSVSGRRPKDKTRRSGFHPCRGVFIEPGKRTRRPRRARRDSNQESMRATARQASSKVSINGVSEKPVFLRGQPLEPSPGAAQLRPNSLQQNGTRSANCSSQCLLRPPSQEAFLLAVGFQPTTYISSCRLHSSTRLSAWRRHRRDSLIRVMGFSSSLRSPRTGANRARHSAHFAPLSPSSYVHAGTLPTRCAHRPPGCLDFAGENREKALSYFSRSWVVNSFHRVAGTSGPKQLLHFLDSTPRGAVTGLSSQRGLQLPRCPWFTTRSPAWSGPLGSSRRGRHHCRR